MSGKKNVFDFAPASIHDWEKTARQELSGRLLQELVVSANGLAIQPYYHSPDNQLQTKIKFKTSAFLQIGARSWVNAPKILVTDEKKSNAQALLQLNSGAEGIFFELKTIKIGILFRLSKARRFRKKSRECFLIARLPMCHIY